MLLWICTAAAGVSLLAARQPARGSGDAAPDAAEVPGEAPVSVPVAASGGAPHSAAAAAPAPAVSSTGVPAASMGVPAAAAEAYAAGAKVPPITHTRITARAGEHPLLEFMHPALGLIGLGCWIAFVITRFSAFAWVALGVIVATIAAGVTWYAVNSRAMRGAQAAWSAVVAETAVADGGVAADGAGVASRGVAAGRGAAPDGGAAANRVPAWRARRAQRVLIHGSAASVTLVLAVVTALITHHA